MSGGLTYQRKTSAMRSLYTVFADDIYVSDHAGYVASCLTARTAALIRPGVKLRVQREDPNGDITALATYVLERGKLRIWML